MKRYRSLLTPLAIIGVLAIAYWAIFYNYNVKVIVVNESEVIYDSIRVEAFPEQAITFYKVSPHDTLTAQFKIRNFNPDKRAYRPVASVSAFKDDYYYNCGDGYNANYTSKAHHNFYIWNNNITVEPINPDTHAAEKYKISDIQKIVNTQDQ